MNDTVKKEKTPNYSESQVKEISKIGDPTKYKSFEEQKKAVEELAVNWNGVKTPRQILAKLQNLAKTSNGKIFYHKKVYQPKVEGTTVIHKAEIIQHIAGLIGCDEEAVESLGSATKAALLVITGALEKAKELPFETELPFDTE